MEKKTNSIKERLSETFCDLCEELDNLVSQQKMWDSALAIVNCFPVGTDTRYTEEYNHCLTMREKLNKDIVKQVMRVAAVHKRLTTLTADQKKYDTLDYSIEDIVDGITKNVPMDYSSFKQFMILLTANIGELLGRIDGLPDSIDWKKDALDKLRILLNGGKKHG